MPNERIALDIDEPADLLEFLKVGAGTITYAEAMAMNLSEKLAPALENR